MYRPGATFTVPMVLLTPTYTTINGVVKKTYPAVASGTPFNGSFKTYGGTEQSSNGVLVVEDTAEIETWYDPGFSSECRIALANTPSAIYDIIGQPENIELRNQFIKFKVRRVKGGA